MIVPTKHLDLDRSLLRVSSEVLRFMKKKRIASYPAVVQFVKSKIGDDGDIVIGPALNFLFLIGRLEYRIKTDAFEYLDGDRG